MSSFDWNALSAVWDRFEGYGLDPEALDAVAVGLKSPVLVVGSGQGLLQEGLQLAGFQAVGVDSSLPMLRQAVQRRRTTACAAAAEHLPFSDQCFRSAVIATGVLDSRWLNDGCRIVAEVQRVVDVSGIVLVGCFLADTEAAARLRELGLIVHGRQQNDRIVALWRRARLGDGSAAQLVADWTGGSVAAANMALHRHVGVVRGIVACFDRVREQLIRAGHAPESFLDAYYCGEVGFFTRPELELMVWEAGADTLGWHGDESRVSAVCVTSRDRSNACV